MLLAWACVVMVPWAASAEDGKSVRSFYFGNSLTAGTAPEFHDQLAKSCGDVWVADKFFIGGSPLRIFVELLFPQYPDMAYHWRPNDNRKFIEITSEVADALADVIWDVVADHPDTGV